VRRGRGEARGRGKREVEEEARGGGGGARQRAGMVVRETTSGCGRAGDSEHAAEMRAGMGVRETASAQNASGHVSHSGNVSRRVLRGGNQVALSCRWRCDGVAQHRNAKRGAETREQGISRALCGLVWNCGFASDTFTNAYVAVSY
jgi:hypothetical protein